MNRKDMRVRKLWERGVCDPKVIARKIGYNGNAMTAGIEWVKDAFIRLGIQHG